jgi:hypothetical protein
MTISQLLQVILQDILNVLTNNLFWRVIAAGVLFALGQIYPTLSEITNTLIAALSVTIVVSGGVKIGTSFRGETK